MKRMKKLVYFAVLFVALGVFYSHHPAKASAGTFAPLVDTDFDGLDDLLEFRLGTNADSLDTDSDGLSDYEELLANTDPLTWEDMSHMTPSPGLYANLYAFGDTFYLTVGGLSAHDIVDVRYSLANQRKIFTVPEESARPYLVKYENIASSGGFNVYSATYQLPLALLSRVPSAAIAVTAIVDGVQFSETRMLTHVDEILAEILLPDESLGRGAGNGGDPAGGLSPVQPIGGGEPPYPGTSDEVCVQTLEAIGSLEGGRIAYRVSEAGCSSMANAVCFTGCLSSAEDIVIGIDIVSLLGD